MVATDASLPPGQRAAPVVGAIHRRTQVAYRRATVKPIRSAAEDKFDRLFDAEQKAYVESRLERIDF